MYKLEVSPHENGCRVNVSYVKEVGTDEHHDPIYDNVTEWFDSSEKDVNCLILRFDDAENPQVQLVSETRKNNKSNTHTDDEADVIDAAY